MSSSTASSNRTTTKATNHKITSSDHHEEIQYIGDLMLRGVYFVGSNIFQIFEQEVRKDMSPDKTTLGRVSDTDRLEGNRLLYVDVAKCVALIIIIIGHTQWGGYISFVDNMALPVFWICSGYTSREDFSIRRKGFTLLVPYIGLSFLCLIYKLWDTGWVWDYRYLEGFLYSRFTIYPLPSSECNPAIMTMYNSVLWFLTSMFSTFLVLKLIYKYARTFKFQLIAVLILLILQWGLSYLPVLLPWSLDTTPFVASLMLIGHWLRKYRFLERRYLWIYLSACIILYIPANWICGPTNYSVREMGLCWPASWVCGLTGTVVLLYLCRLAGKNIITTLMAMLDRQALFIFGLQLVLIDYSTSYIISRMPDFSMLRMWITVGFCFIGGYVIGTIYTNIKSKITF